MAAAGGVAIPRKGDPEQGEVMSKIAGCFGCHGVLGMSVKTGVPKLAGQNDLYLIKQIKALRRSSTEPNRPIDNDQRYHFFMSSQVASLTNADISDLSKYYSGLNCR